jgi:hypothetical protein
MSLPIPLINQHQRMFLKSWSGLRREHRQLVFRIGQGGDDRRLGEMEGAEAQPIPAVGLRSFGLGDREDRSRPAFANLAALRWPMFGIMPALLWPSVRPPWGLPDCDSDNRFQYHYMWCRKRTATELSSCRRVLLNRQNIGGLSVCSGLKTGRRWGTLAPSPEMVQSLYWETKASESSAQHQSSSIELV